MVPSGCICRKKPCSLKRRVTMPFSCGSGTTRTTQTSGLYRKHNLRLQVNMGATLTNSYAHSSFYKTAFPVQVVLRITDTESSSPRSIHSHLLFKCRVLVSAPAATSAASAANGHFTDSPQTTLLPEPFCVLIVFDLCVILVLQHHFHILYSISNNLY